MFQKTSHVGHGWEAFTAIKSAEWISFYTKAYLKSQRIVSRVNEEEKSVLLIKEKKPAGSNATVDKAWVNHGGEIYPG